MPAPKLYIIAGCNGAGKTTASFTILPQILGCHHFVNADEIAKTLPGNNSELNTVIAGRQFLTEVNRLIGEKEDLAVETTLASRSYQALVRKAHENGYKVYLLFFWLDNVELAKQRVAQRVRNGGHNIPTDVIERRYIMGMQNLEDIFLPICDYVIIIDNAQDPGVIIAEKPFGGELMPRDSDAWNRFQTSHKSKNFEKKITDGLDLTYRNLVAVMKEKNDDLIYSLEGEIRKISAREVDLTNMANANKKKE